MQILAAALEMFESRLGEIPSVAVVAARAGVAKGTVYLYFRSKEEIFLALLEEHLHAWIDHVETGLEVEAAGPERLVETLCAHVLAHPAILRLAALSSAVLERNIEATLALRFRRGLARHLTVAGQKLEAALPGLEAGDGARLLRRSHALLLGLWQTTEPAPVVREVLAADEMALLRVDLEREARAALLALWRGTPGLQSPGTSSTRR